MFEIHGLKKNKTKKFWKKTTLNKKNYCNINYLNVFWTYDCSSLRKLRCYQNIMENTLILINYKKTRR